MDARSGPDQAEEIAATVWFTLCRHSYAGLRRFDPGAGRLITYLAAMARRELWKRRREDLNRRTREWRAARANRVAEAEPEGILLDELFEALTPREREFCQSCLTGRRSSRISSAASEWKLRSRVLKKIRERILQNIEVR